MACVTVETARALLITKVTWVSKVDDTRHISTSYSSTGMFNQDGGVFDSLFISAF